MHQIQEVPHGFTGTISVQLADLIQMICLARSDLVIRVSGKSGDGTINIRNGRIHHAQTGDLLGEAAFFEVLGWNDGQFQVLPPDDAADSSIDKPWEYLLLEAMRQQDETGSNCEEIGSSHGESKSLDIGGLFDNLDSNLAPNDSCDLAGRDKVEPESALRTVKVLIVDDSSFFTKKLQEMLESDSAIEVVGIARNGREMLQILNSGIQVDIVTLDIEMPVMPGETSIKHIMIGHRLPVLIISSFQLNSMDKMIDFLKLGAVDFIAKPQSRDDHSAYAQNLCELVKGASMARLSHFRRLRKQEERGLPETQVAPSVGNNLIVIVGAEGAHIEWFRIPYRKLFQRGLVIGLQKLPEHVLPAFAKSIEKRIGVRTEPLLTDHRILRGCFYLGNPRKEAIFSLSDGNSALEMKVVGPVAVNWREAVEMWLLQLAKEARDSLRICLLSGVDALSEATLDRLFDFKVRLILLPKQSATCGQLIDCVHSYAQIHPDQILICEPNSFAENV